jgi:hypothetical protein
VHYYISDCRKTNGMVDVLHSGKELSDRHLVLQLLRGLSKKYGHMKAFIKCTKPLPSFHVVRIDHKLEELDMEIETDQRPPQLYAMSSTASCQQLQQHAALTASSMLPPPFVPTGGPPCPAAPPASTRRKKGR